MVLCVIEVLGEPRSGEDDPGEYGLLLQLLRVAKSKKKAEPAQKQVSISGKLLEEPRNRAI